jgi:hypothetical protein
MQALARMSSLAARLLAAIAVAAAAIAVPGRAQTPLSSPVTARHLEEVRALFARNAIAEGQVALDPYGRIELKGGYADEQEVDRAFSLAQTVVGVRWVSPVTPENIKVKAWERELGSLFSRARVLAPPARAGTAPGPVRHRFALVVGVGRFQYGINPLDYAVRDAALFYQFLTDPGRGRFPRENVTYLVDEHATRGNVLAALDRIRAMAGEDDLVVVYISSHGTPPDKKGAVNIVTYDTEVKPRERIWHTSLTEDAMREFVAGLRAQRLVMVLDTCYSNGAYRAVPGFLPPGGKSLGAGDDEGYGLSEGSGRRLLGAKDLVLEGTVAAGQPKNLSLGDTDHAWGKVLIGASAAGERSWESEQLKNSVFTYYFIEGLNRHQGSVQSAFYYAQPLVAQRVKQEKGVDIEQNPQVMATHPNWNMRLVQAPAR